MDWQLLDDEEGSIPLERPSPPPPPRRRRGSWLLVPLLLGAVVVTALWWQHERREAQLRERFTEIVHNEARVLRSADSQAARTLFDPDAPTSWRFPYMQGAWFSAMGALLPEVRDVVLSEGGERAVVTVDYPRPDGPLYTGLAPVPERRAYRLVEGQWRRTPMALDRSERIEARSATFTLRGPRASVEALDFLAEAERIRALLAEQWPAAQVEEARLTIEIQPREFEGLTNPFASIGYTNVTNVTFPIVLNSLDSFVAAPEIPLSGEAQYRLAAAQQIVYRLSARRAWPITTRSGDQAQLLWHSAISLRRAQAEGWALSEEEQRAMVAWRRSRLAGAWHAPLSGEAPRFDMPERRTYELSLDLLIDYVWLTYGDRAIGQLAERIANGAPEQSLATFFSAGTGEPVEALERAARDFALSEEP